MPNQDSQEICIECRAPFVKRLYHLNTEMNRTMAKLCQVCAEMYQAVATSGYMCQQHREFLKHDKKLKLLSEGGDADFV